MSTPKVPPAVSLPDGPVQERDVAGFRLKPQYVNRFQVVVGGDHVRVVFGDAAFGTDATYHSAVVMSKPDARSLIELLERLLKSSEEAVSPESGTTGL